MDSPETVTAEVPKKIVKLTSLKSDLEKERIGDWVIAADIPGVRWFVRSTNYAAFKIARSAHSAKLARKYGDDIPDEILAEISGKLAVEHLLLDWDGLDVPYSKEKAHEILEDEAYRVVRASVYLAAVKVGQGEVEHIEGTIKN